MKSRLPMQLILLTGMLMFSKNVLPQCNNVTNGGTIGSDQVNCGQFNPAAIVNLGFPSGGTGTIEYQWQSSPDGTAWTNIAGASFQNYDPTTISSTTHYKRLSRRSGCTAFDGISNVVIKTVNFPVAATITPGGSTSFCGAVNVLLTASSGTGLSYQWRRDFVTIGGATLQTYTATQPGYYTVVVTVVATGCASVSPNLYVSSDSPLTTTITNDGLFYCAASTIHMTVPSAPNYIYQWFEDSHPIPGTNNYEFLTGHDGTYSCTITNGCGSYPSAPLTVNDFQNTGFPEHGTIGASGTVVCTGSTVLLYEEQSQLWGWPAFPNLQWYLNGNPISGATNYSYDASQPGDYSLQIIEYFWCVQNFSGSFTNWITLTSSTSSVPGVSITAGGSTSFCTGGSVSLSATLTGGTGYQWQRNGSDIAGATNSTYVASISGIFRCTSSNSCGTGYSNAIGVTATAPPSANIFANGPTTFCTGGSVPLSVNTATGITHQWQLNSNPISGATSNTYTASAAGVYNCVNTNSCGVATSNSITVTVNSSFTASATAAGATIICPGGSVVINASPTGGGYAYQWRLDGIMIPGATSSSFTANSAGDFDVRITSGCTATSGIVSVSYSGGSTFVLQPGSTGTDATVWSHPSNASINFGNDVDLDAESWTWSGVPATLRGYLQFDLSTIPSNAIVVQAMLALYNNPTSGNNGGSHSSMSGSNASWIQRVTSPWNESTITWNTQPAITTSGQATIPQSIDAHQDYNINISGIVQTMVSNPTTNYGMLLRLQTESYYRALVFASGDNNNASKRPRLRVHYFIPPATTVTAAGPTTFCSGNSVDLNVTSAGAIGYQWRLNSVNIPGATSSSYTASSSGDYSCIVSDGCNNIPSNSVTVTVENLPSNVITAGGPTSFCNGTYVTLNAATGNGYTYQWSVNGSSIALATGSSYNADVSGSYTCQVTNACGALVSNSIVVDVDAPPAIPSSITGSTNICTNSFGVGYSVNAVNGVTYLWSVPAGATISSGQGTNSITVDFGSGATAGNICVDAGNACGTSAQSCIAVAVSSIPVITNSITGSNAACANTTGNIYSISGVIGATSYTWTLPTGASFVSGQGTSSITVSFGSNGSTGNICVYPGNACGTNFTCKAITAVLQPVAPASISGTSIPCANSTGVTYFCPPVSNATSYTWSVPASATITSGQGTTSITVNFNSSFTSGTVAVAAVNCAGNSVQRTLQVYGIPAVPASINGPSTAVCQGSSNIQYTIAAVPGATSYNWTAPANASITLGQGTTTVRINFNGGFSSGTLNVRAVNACGTSAARTLSISSAPPIPGTITGPSTFCANQLGVSYSVAPVIGATTYQWDIPVGATFTGGQGTSAITINYGTHSGKVKVRAGNACGYSAYKILNVYKTCREAMQLDESSTAFTAIVFPNPSSSHFSLSVNSESGTVYQFILRDFAGREIDRKENIPVTEKIEFGNTLTSGIYIAEIVAGENRKVIKIIKQ